jgi:NTE family protein
MSARKSQVRFRLPAPMAFAFSGGLARTAAQIGMVPPLIEAGLDPNLVVGTSAGAVNAALFAADPSEFVAAATDLWAGVAKDKALTSIRRSTVRGLALSQASRTRNMLRKHFERAFGSLDFDELSLPLGVTTTELESGRAVVIESGSVVDALLASLAFPGVMPPSELLDGELVVDGSVVADVPVLEAMSLGAKSVVILDSGSSVVDDSTVEDIRWYHVMALAATHMLRSQARHQVDAASATIPVVVVSSGSGDPFDLRNALDTVSVGEEAARRVLKDVENQRGSRRRLLQPGRYGDELLSQ